MKQATILYDYTTIHIIRANVHPCEQDNFLHEHTCNEDDSGMTQLCGNIELTEISTVIQL